MRIVPTDLPGVLLLEPKVFGDDRGFFLETYQQARYDAAGIAGPFVQDNVSSSTRGVLRGLHFQEPHAQGKLVYVLEGEVFDVAVDVRRGSPTYGAWTGASLSLENKRQMYVPPGFAHGFLTLSKTALFVYKCTDTYHPECEHSILWNDPDLGIEWPTASPRLSGKDAAAPRLRDLDSDALPKYP